MHYKQCQQCKRYRLHRDTEFIKANCSSSVQVDHEFRHDSSSDSDCLQLSGSSQCGRQGISEKEEVAAARYTPISA